MKVTLIMLFSAVLWVATIASAQAAEQHEAGMKAYAAQKCSVCHAIAGKGNAKGPLDDVGSRLSADEIRQWIVNPAEMTKKSNAPRKPPMKSYASLSKEDVEALVAYMQTLKKK
jgi:mono/diheme cytochrome c family protein